jgi:hypothetical protein
VADRDIPYEIPEPEYVEVDTMRVSRMRSDLNNGWAYQIPEPAAFFTPRPCNRVVVV